MNASQVPATILGIQLTAETVLPAVLVVVLAILLLQGVRREFAAFAIAAGVVGAILMS